MMDYQLVLDSLEKTPQLILGLALMWQIRKNKDYDSHLEKCEKAPNELILEKLKTLGTQLEIIHTRINTTREEAKRDVSNLKLDIKEDIKRLDESYHSFKETTLKYMLEDIPKLTKRRRRKSTPSKTP